MNEAPRLAAPDGGFPGEGKKPRQSRFERLIERARLTLLWEGLWPGLWPPLGVVALFVAISLMGVWLWLPPVARMVGCGIALAAFLVSLIPLIRLSLPSRRLALARLDRDRGCRPPACHRASTTSWRLARRDPATRALWEAHRRRAEEGLAALKVHAPRPNMTGRDRFALRAGAILALVTGAFVAGQDFRFAPHLGVRLERGGRAWSRVPHRRLGRSAALHAPAAHHPRIQGRRARANKIRVPIKSTMVIRAAGETSTWRDHRGSGARGLAGDGAEQARPEGKPLHGRRQCQAAGPGRRRDSLVLCRRGHSGSSAGDQAFGSAAGERTRLADHRLRG